MGGFVSRDPKFVLRNKWTAPYPIVLDTCLSRLILNWSVTQGRWVGLVISFQSVFDLLLIGPNPQGLELSCQVNGNISTRVPCHRERENSISIQNNTRNFNNPFSLQPLENCEEAIHGEWKTNRHRGKIFRAFAGLKANMTQIKSEILLYKIKEAYFDSPSLNRRGRSILAGECGSTTT